MISFTRWSSALALTLGLSLSAHAWPDRAVKVVVPYGAGGMGDIVARLIGEDLRAALGQPVIIENRPGAGGNIGAAAVERAAPDGYTLLVVPTNNLVVNQFLYKKLGYDPLVAFEPVSFLINVPSVLCVQPAIGRDFAEFSAKAKAQKGKLNFGSPGNGTTPHLSMQAINQAMGWGMIHVPFQGAAPAIVSLLGGDIQAYVGGAGLALQHVQGGKLVAAAVSSGKRLAVLPQTPTFAEVGMGSIKASNWWAMVAPKGTPPDVVERLNAALREALSRPQNLARFEQLGVEAYPTSPKEMAQQLAEEAVFWKSAVAQAGVSLD